MAKLSAKVEPLILSAIQLNSKTDIDINIATIEKYLQQLISHYKNSVVQHLVVLPECCLFFGGKDAEQLQLAKQTNKNKMLMSLLSKLAKTYQVTLVAGSIPLLFDEDKFTNSCCVFSPSGDILGQYDKIHLFDVDVNDNEKRYFESKFTEKGCLTTVIETQGVNVGLSICFDLRFAGLFQQLRAKAADIITIPSAFTRVTGQAHWQALLQARAIENQVYIIAAAQEGVHENGRETWGHSMIISPWGEILTTIPTGEGLISCSFSELKIKRIRAEMPVITQNQFTVELKN